VPLCLSRYGDSYASGFASSYQSIYSTNFRSVFDASVAGAYQTALAPTNASAFQSGRSRGAEDQGILDGFAARLTSARPEQKQQGKDALTSDLRTGAIVFLRSAALEDLDGNGILSPADPVKLKLVIDNLGLEATALNHLRVRVNSNHGFDTLTVSLRDLP